MFSTKSNLKAVTGDFHLDRMMRYSVFVPRLYNLCKSLGFESGKILPSRTFCSDESQGFPIILITSQGRRLVFISCLNIDISTWKGQLFPLIKSVPWAAFIQDENGNHQTLEQAEIIARLEEQSTDNPDQIDPEDTIVKMGREKEIRIPV